MLVGRGAACALAGASRVVSMSLFMQRPAPSATGLRVRFRGQAQHADQHLAGLRQATRGGDPEVLPAGMVLARALSHAAELVHGSDAMISAVQGASGLSPCSGRSIQLNCDSLNARTDPRQLFPRESFRRRRRDRMR